MRPLKLSFSAFGPYAGKQKLDFAELKGRTFFLIHGSTGAGKTTILDAICFALYGDSSGNLRDGRTMRSSHAGLHMPTEVEFTFALGQDTYRVWRSPEQERAKKRGEGTTVSLADSALHKVTGGQEKLLASGYSNVTAKAEELLGFKSGQFRQVVLLPQGDFRRLLLANSLERQEIMQALFKTELYKAIEENLKEGAKAIRLEREALATKRDFILQELGVQSVEALEHMLRDEIGLCAAERATVQKLDAERKAMQQQLADEQLILNKFETLAKAQDEQTACEELLPKVREYQTLYRRAELAAKQADVETQVEEADAICVKREQELAAAAVKTKAALWQTEQAAEVMKREEAKSGEQDAVSRQLMQLAALADKRRLLQAALDDEQVKNLVAQEALKRLTATENSTAALQATLKEAQEKLQSFEKEMAKEKEYHLELAKLREIEGKILQHRRLGGEAEKAGRRQTAARQALTAAEKDDAFKKAEARRLAYLFAEGQAAVLARQLRDGCPCPVCGAAEHPHPAEGADFIPGEAEVNSAQTAAESAEKARQAAEHQVAAMQTEYDTLVNRQKDVALAFTDSMPEIETIREDIRVLIQKVNQIAVCQKDSVLLIAQIAKMASEEAKCAAILEQSRQARQTADNAWQAALAITGERREALPEKYRNPEALLNEENALKGILTQLKEGLAAARQKWQHANDEKTVCEANYRHCLAQAEESKKHRQAVRQMFVDRLARSGFASAEEYQAAKRKPEFLTALAERIAKFEERIIAAKKALQAAVEMTACLIRPEIERSRELLSGKEEAYNAAFARLCRREDDIVKRQMKQKQLAQLEKQLGDINARYAVTGTLAEVANGMNAHGMTFQRFVLKSLLQDVIEASNLRLKMMSRGRYMLQDTDERTRKNAAGGLEIEVFDHYTGYARPVVTLSGGETFLASLSLALGLADVVQSYAGGIYLDTILVDEGFGTLDSESLDTAIRALVDLQRGGRLVGIISHVTELKERIDARLEVTKGKDGSTAAFVVG